MPRRITTDAHLPGTSRNPILILRLCPAWKYKNTDVEDKSSDQGLSLNRSRYESRSTGYNPLTSNQVVYK